MKENNFINFSYPEELRNTEILNYRMRLYNRISGPRVGDYIRFQDGTLSRFTYDWNCDNSTDQVIQHGGNEHGRFYLGENYISYSGSLNIGIIKNQLQDTGERKPGHIWFFKNDFWGADRGISYYPDFRIYELIL